VTAPARQPKTAVKPTKKGFQIRQGLGGGAPEVVVISVGADNDFGHPCAGVLERLGELPVYRTDEQGVVEIVTDGAQAWVETER
jgi:hypothetical protein